MTDTAFSVIVPAFDEAESVGPLLDEILRETEGQPLACILVVDDASRDGTAAAVEARAAAEPRIRLIRHARNAGKSAAIHTGVMAATTPLACTLDADGQNPPAEIAALMAALTDGLPGGVALVAGQRKRRNDNVTKQWASRLANGLRARVLNDATRDTACGLKAFRCDAYRALPYFDNMHRYLPALFKRDGWGVAHVAVEDRPRSAGVSKYNNLQRGLVGAVDLLGVAWLMRRRKATAPAAALLQERSGA